MPRKLHAPARLLLAGLSAALIVPALPLHASDAPMRKVRCYGLDRASEAQPAPDAEDEGKVAKAKPKKKKKDYEVMYARDCAMAGGRLGAPK
jgi:hypothetical protein